jgi:hypothetical protein
MNDRLLEQLAEDISWLIEKTNYRQDEDCPRRLGNKKRIYDFLVSAINTSDEPYNMLGEK